MRFVIVGGGIAGTTAAEELRKRLPEAGITLVSEEFHPLYSRVLLPHYMLGKVPRARVFLKKPEWYEANRIEWLPGTFVTALDPRNGFVALSDGRELPFDKLLVATGTQPRLSPLQGRNACAMRTLDDADHIIKLLDEARYPSPVSGEGMGEVRGVVYGGGFIACEFVNLFAHRGLPTTVRLRGDRFFSSALDDASWEIISECLAASGIKVETASDKDASRPSMTPLSPPLVRGDGLATIEGVGIGTEADLSWAREAGLAVGQGIKADEYLETSLPDVWTAGDVAEFTDIAVGRQRLSGTWMSAQMQGRCAASNMAGERVPFHLVSSQAIDLLGTPVTLVGDASRAHAQEARTVRVPGGAIQLFGRDGQLVGGTLVGTATGRQRVTDGVKAKAPFKDFSLD